jgi:Ca-activated chloride channel family protein
LLPAPAFRGPETVYDDGYLTRLAAIRALQAAHVPLDAIAARLDAASPAEMARLATGSSAPTEPPGDVAPTKAPSSEPRFPHERTVRFTLADGLVLEAREPLPPATEALLTALLEAARSRLVSPPASPSMSSAAAVPAPTPSTKGKRR